ncbi:beta-glucosidase BglX [Mangrovibacterium diazotrophicum]|uniref:Periplasmic beta-glucosidase n=1 Tax=Mangrovibacterium diazotrophicum TaxID=1261403 RepID=A0A419W5J1_9BACT|nr:beta-glucosidase BglX [Mangrovibacterium diazotrophicum]RKD90705.1 beta-glucosidase [Mangrovibacterium diazotrophicum]
MKFTGSQRLSALILLAFFCPICLWAGGVNADKSIERKLFIDALMSKMTLDEKLGQLNLLAWDGSLQTGAAANSGVSEKVKNGLVGGLFNIESKSTRMEIQKLAVEQSRLGIPIIFAQDVIHGHRTVFPIPLALSCSWDTELIERTARAAATEAASDGIDWVFSPMVDVSRDPRWGRVAEGAGEDPYLGSLIAKAMVKGYQGEDMAQPGAVMACVKHFALYGAGESGRDYNTVDMSEIKMFQDYLPPYRAAVDAGVGSVMTAFNDINGVPATSNKWLIDDVLRKDWGFDGFIATDYTAIREMGAHGIGDLETCSALALDAGIDMDMVSEGFVNTLKNSLEKGTVSMDEIDQACRRVLEAKYQLGLFDDPFLRLKDNIAEEGQNEEFMNLALEAARKSAVLLKNESSVLPLTKGQKIAVVGPLADSKKATMGTWVLNGDTSQVITVLEGLRKRTAVSYVKGARLTDDEALAKLIGYPMDEQSSEELIEEAIEVATFADVVVAVLGESAVMNGEAASLADINLQASQKELLQKLVETGKPVVLVLLTGRPLTLEWEDANCAAILQCWSAGSQTGNAVADILYGDFNPSGKLTMSFPRKVGQVPVYYSMKTTGRPFWEGVKYTSRYLDVPNTPLYPFGFGLSYTSFDVSDIQLDKNAFAENDTLTATINLTNTGEMAGEETVQLYLRDLEASVTRPRKELKHFQKVFLKPGETKTVRFKITVDDLMFYNSELEYQAEAGEFRVEIGLNSESTKTAIFEFVD